MKTMKTLTINGTKYEVVDEAARADGGSGGGSITVEDSIDEGSTNPVQGDTLYKRFNSIDEKIKNKITPRLLPDVTEEAEGKMPKVVDGKVVWAEANTGGGGSLPTEYNVVNVRDFGALGDGANDDRQAIIDAFGKAKTMLPCEVYFPAGTYGISNGITVEMLYGTGGLRVRGAGRDITTIKYLDSYNPDETGGNTQWYALRIWPEGMPDSKPQTDDEYLHDISITGLTVYDPNPIAHAWQTVKGDPDGEETHGFDIQYCKRVSVTDCNIINVGDECIDICGCHDVVVMNNHIVNAPAAGSAGGAISIGDGCNGVVVSGNTVNGSAADEVLTEDITLAAGTKLSCGVVLPDGTTKSKGATLSAETTLPAGTILVKTNFGIAVESLLEPVVNVTITGNTISNTKGNGINFAATNPGSCVSSLVIANNVIANCTNGIRGMGSYTREGIRIGNNTISDCTNNAIYIDGAKDGHCVKDIAVCGNTIRNVEGEYAIYIATLDDSSVMVTDNHIENAHHSAMFLTGQSVVRNCVLKSIGITDNPRATAKLTGAIYRYDGTMTVSGCKLLDIRLKGAKCGIQYADYIEHTDIELIHKTSGASNAGGDAIAGTETKRIIGGHFGGRVRIAQANAIVNGLTITSTSIGNAALIIAAKGVVVTGCNIMINSNYNAIAEETGADYNLIANNITNSTIKAKVGDHTVIVNNITGAVTA